MEMIKRLVKEEEGQGMVEYALIVAAIAVAVMGILYFMGDKIAGKFEDINTQLDQ